ncbi:hypothetical protein [Adhaeribacter aerolatus]|nr:hypothetical protein [Adhaeribacter aerolatus]
MEHRATARKVRYSQDSERLWEPGPQCTPTKVKFKFTYRSKYQNAYNEPVFYVKEDEPNRIQPVVTGNIPGFFNAYPGGLNIDSQTGEIDINNSDAGVRYTVEFTPCGADCVIRTQVVISGIGYEGGFFSLSSPGDLNIRPFYFGSNSPDEQVPSQEVPARKAPDGTFGLNPLPNRKPTADLLLTRFGLNPESAVIDLRNFIRSGALGFRRNPDGSCDSFPENGTSRDFTIYYRLKSGPGADILNKTKVRIHFFDTEADMPHDLKVRIRQQSNSIFRKSLPLAMLPGLSGAFLTDSPWETLAAFLTALTSFLFLMPKAKESSSPLAPPEICIGR